MKTLEERLISPSIPEFPREKGRYIVEIDAYNEQVGAVSLQEQLDRRTSPI